MLSLFNSSMKTLLVVLLSAQIVYGQDTLYGMQMQSFSGSSAPSSNTGSSGTSSSGMGWDSLEPASVSSSGGATGRGRIVSNSILDLDEPGTMDMEDDNMQMVFGQQPSIFPMMMPRPVMSGPSIGTGQMLEPTRSTSGNGMGMSGIGASGNSNGVSNNKVHRYVSVHVPPPEPMLSPRMRPSQATQKPETHYQILFIKAPSTMPQEIQQIQLPPPPRMKTLVYVLLKKDSMSDLLKISQPPKVKPAKPEVFFIKYKSQKPQQSRDEQKPETEDMMISNGNMNVNNGIGNNNEQGTRPRSTSTTRRPSEAGSINRGMGMVQQQGSAVSGPLNGGMGMMQASGVSGTPNRGMGMMQVGDVTSVNKGMGMMQASGGSGPANRGMGMVQSSGGSGASASNNGIQMGMAQATGGYGNPEIADSDFSSDFNENQYLQAYRRQHHQNQRQVRSGFTFFPSRRYGIVN